MKRKQSLRGDTIAGILWSGLGQFGSQGIHYVVILVLAWLLSPSDFGLVGLAMIFITITQKVGELGLAAPIIQRKQIEEPLLSTVFWANLGVSCAMVVITWILAPLITQLLGNTDATPLLRALSLILPITAISVVPRALLEKSLLFDQLARRDLMSELGFGIAGITLALMGKGVWALVGASLAQRLINTSMLWHMVPWKPELSFSLRDLKANLGFGIYVLGAALLNKSVATVDYFVVGRWLGTEALGYYTLAFQLAIVPAQRLVGLLQNVAFPSFAKIHEDQARLRTGFLGGIQHLFAALTLISLLLVVLSPPLISLIYGEKWLPSGNIMRILAIAIFFYGFDIAQPVYFAVGKPVFRILIIGLRFVVFVFCAATFGLSFNITGIALSMTLAVASSSYLGFVAVSHIIDTPLAALFHPLIPSLRAAAIAALPGLIVFIFPPNISPIILIILLGITTLSLYLLALFPTYRSLLKRTVPYLTRSLKSQNA